MAEAEDELMLSSATYTIKERCVGLPQLGHNYSTEPVPSLPRGTLRAMKEVAVDLGQRTLHALLLGEAATVKQE